MARSGALLCVLALASVALAAGDTVAVWAQCGGKSGMGDDKAVKGCADGSKCVRQSEWYWQCKPSDQATGSDSKDNGSHDTEQDDGSKDTKDDGHDDGKHNSGDVAMVAVWAQCGGKSGMGDDKAVKGCADGSKCVRQSEWYWQCKPSDQATGSDSKDNGSHDTEQDDGSRDTKDDGHDDGKHNSGDVAMVAVWAQCGGKSGMGDDKAVKGCADGSKCVRQSEWYWQCKPSDQATGSDSKDNGSHDTEQDDGSRDTKDDGHDDGKHNSGDVAMVAVWAQCGGKSGMGDDKAVKGCADGSKCVRQSEWYWQCKPSDQATGSDSKDNGSHDTEQDDGSKDTKDDGHDDGKHNSGDVAMVAVWAQCGGKSGMGDDKAVKGCADGSKCVRQSEWYWQCKPSDQATGSDSKDNGSHDTEQDDGSRDTKDDGHDDGKHNSGDVAMVAVWAQCGGKSGMGDDKAVKGCADGSKCVRQSEWYWQCKPSDQATGSDSKDNGSHDTEQDDGSEEEDDASADEEEDTGSDEGTGSGEQDTGSDATQDEADGSDDAEDAADTGDDESDDAEDAQDTGARRRARRLLCAP